jgi:hypothetical protein
MLFKIKEFLEVEDGLGEVLPDHHRLVSVGDLEVR